MPPWVLRWDRGRMWSRIVNILAIDMCGFPAHHHATHLCGIPWVLDQPLLHRRNCGPGQLGACDRFPVLEVGLLILATTLKAGDRAGLFCTHADLSPRYAGVRA